LIRSFSFLTVPKTNDKMVAKQWADGPFELIETPSLTMDPTNKAVIVASDMAMAHNGLIRGLNSVYLQAEGVNTPEDIADFLVYAQCWSDCLEHHHDGEEEKLFPVVEEYTGEQGIMEYMISGHEAFHEGHHKYKEYVYNTSVADYDGKKLKAIIDDFAPVLIEHLRDEIPHLLSLEKYGADRLLVEYEKFANYMATSSSKTRNLPFVLGTSDNTFEGGKVWPPNLPFFVPYLTNYVFSRKYAGAWKFSPCTMLREPRELQYVS